MIYLIEDDSNIRELVVYTLNSLGMEAKGFTNSAEFWDILPRQRPDLLLLDIMLPGEDGLTVLKRLREQAATATLPVIMVTARGNEYDRVIGLDLGADDYVTKPFGMMELIARIKAVLRRTQATPRAEKCLRVGALQLDVQRHAATLNGEPITLTRKEYELLQLLMRNPGIVFTRDQLLNNIWGYAFDGENRTVDVHIRMLRQKLGSAGDCIETVRGVGYKIGGAP